MSISVYAHITKATEVAAILRETEAGKYAVFSTGDLAVFGAGDLVVLINNREKLLEIASLLESVAQKWED